MWGKDYGRSPQGQLCKFPEIRRGHLQGGERNVGRRTPGLESAAVEPAALQSAGGGIDKASLHVNDESCAV